MRITNFLSTIALFVFPNLSHGQDLPLDMGTPVDEPEVQITVKDPVFIFLTAANGTRYHRVEACSRDGGFFAVDMVMASEINHVNYQLSTLGPEASREQNMRFVSSMSQAFQQVASAMNGHDLYRTLADPVEYRESYNTFGQNVAAVKDYLLGRDEPTNDRFQVQFLIQQTIRPEYRNPCNQI